MSQFLNIAHYIKSSKANGPGNRFTIWLQGCPFDCKGCFNQEYRKLTTGTLITPDDLFNIITNTKNIKAVTFSGGEPFYQAQALSELAQKLKKQDYNILCYTGYSLQDLQKSGTAAQKLLLSTIDILIDGRFMEELKTDRKYTGSSNQQIHYLSGSPGENDPDPDLNVAEITIAEDGSIILSGFPDQKLINTTRNNFNDR